MNTNYRGEEICAACGCATGHAGYGEDSIGYVDGTIGPLCDECNARLVEEIEADSHLWNQITELVSRVDATENDAAKLRAANAEIARLREALTAIRDRGKGIGGAVVVTETMLRKIAAQALAATAAGGGE